MTVTSRLEPSLVTLAEVKRLIGFDGHGTRVLSIVHEEAAERLRDACEGTGAVLRFRLHA